ncbi:MAG: AraC family transcriptional regulator [Clostridia bacterium]|nr:AraC family transcriptional regulator [Clostridia bacterium]
MNPNVSQVHISMEDFSPKVLRSYFLTSGTELPKGYKFSKRNVYDYEIEFFLDSNGAMVLDDKVYPVQYGDVAFRKPGQTTQGIMQFNCYLICVDLLGNTNKNSDTYDFIKEQEFQNYYINPVLESIPPLFHPPMGKKYQFLFDSLLKEFINPGKTSAMLLKSYLLQLISELYLDSCDPLLNGIVPLSPYYAVITKVVEYIKHNFQNKLTLSNLAELAGLSPNHLHKVFTRTLGITPNEFITKIRLEKAKELLVKTSLPISNIALNCGFENTPYFSFLFKKQLSFTPGEFRKRYNYIT